MVIVCGLLYLFEIVYDFLASNYPNVSKEDKLFYSGPALGAVYFIGFLYMCLLRLVDQLDPPKKKVEFSISVLLVHGEYMQKGGMEKCFVFIHRS